METHLFNLIGKGKDLPSLSQVFYEMDFFYSGPGCQHLLFNYKGTIYSTPISLSEPKNR